MKMLHFGAIFAVIAAATFGCSGDDDDDTMKAVAGAPSNDGAAGAAGAGGAPAAAPLEIIGQYDDSFMGEQIITGDDWNGAAIVGYDNAQNVVFTQAGADDMFNPNKFGKTVYTEPAKDGSFYFCQVEYALDTLAEAEASTSTADDGAPDTTGCGMFSWTKATPK
jgi:hypothetical protein